MDRNQAIGLTLMGVVLLGYMAFFSSPDQAAIETKTGKDSSITATAANPATTDSSAKTATIATLDSAKATQLFGDWAAAAIGQEQTYTLINQDVKLTFSSKGAQLVEAELLKYRTWDQKPLILFTKGTRIANLSAYDGGTELFASQYYYVAQASPDQIVFRTTNGAGKALIQTYKLPKTGYLLDWSVRTEGLSLAKDLQLSWKQEALPLERDIKAQRITTTVNWHEPTEGYDNLGETNLGAEERAGTAASWISVKQKFFITALLAPKGLGKWSAKSYTNAEDTASIKRLTVAAEIPGKDANTPGGITMQWYLGPNKYHDLKQINSVEDFDKNLYLGWPVINLVNRFVTVNVFNWLEHITSNYGIVIIVLVLMVRLLLLPLGYRSYISMAKMKVLKPELDEIKARVGDDMQAQQAEQMKLYQQVGINPLSGCIPLLLQMPVLFAMFNFFPNAIELRQQTLWWAQDLSTFDDYIHWQTAVPFLGHHLSIFNVLLMFSTLGITYFNNQNTNVNPQMKYIGYIMPVFLMFVLNDLPAGLNFYYLGSNVMSMAQQIIIRKFVNEEDLHRKLQENKTKNANKPKSKFAQRIEEAMKSSEEAKKKKK